MGPIAVDPKLCSGCKICEIVCSLFHEGECNPSLARLHVSWDIFTSDFKPMVCVQCPEAECSHACPVEGALILDENSGAWIINDKLCIGCKRCKDVCPFNVIKYSSRKKVCVKCDLCGGEPKCVEWCPFDTLKYFKK